MIYMGDAYKGLEDDSMGTCGYLGVRGNAGATVQADNAARKLKILKLNRYGN